MENSEAAAAAAAAVVAGVEVTPSPPESKRQRRCVQSKLFWGSSPVGKINGESTADAGDVVAFPAAAELEKNEELEEGKGDGKRKRRSTNAGPKPRAAGKSPVSKVAKRLGPGKKSSPDSNGSCQQPRNPRGVHNRANNDPVSTDVDMGGSHLRQRLSSKYDAVEDLDDQRLQTKQPITNLRLEAKMAAEVFRVIIDSIWGRFLALREIVYGDLVHGKATGSYRRTVVLDNAYQKENMRLSIGKQVHPFFTCRKAAKKLPVTDDVIKLDSTHLSAFDQDNRVFFPPVHILEQQVDDIVLDWSKWNFAQRTIIDYNDCCVRDKSLSVFKDVTRPLMLDTTSISLMHDDQTSVITKETAIPSVMNCPALSDGHDQKQQLISDMKFHLDSNFCSLSKYDVGINNVECENQDTFGDERLLSYYRRCRYWPECTLWTEKYQPEKAEEVCGNHDSVKQLSEWLRFWHDRSSKSSRRCDYGDKYSNEETEDSSYDSDSDVDEDASDLKNVLLITGPVGSGKSAAIYACAKELGFEVIEVNTSDLRHGACLKQKFGDAMESHGLNKWSVGQSICPRTKHILGLQSGKSNFEEKQFESSEAKITSQNSSQAKYSMESPNQIANKTLILFEDVDIVFDADHGLVSTILQLAETTRRPIILTSNCKNPILPLLLSRFALEFELPSTEELLRHCCMICASEKAQISSCLLENFIQSCQGDMRKTLLLLQFWCQGKNHHTVLAKQWSYSPLRFDIDAAHLVLPRVAPWGFHCELSEKVVEEINRTVSLMEENILKLNSAEPAGPLKIRKLTNVRRKKKGKLKRNTSSTECSDFQFHLNDFDDFHDTPDPAAEFAGRVRQKPRLVLSSQSDDSLCADEVPPTEITSVLSDNHPLTEATDILNSKLVEMASFLDVPCEQKGRIERHHDGQYQLQFFGTESGSNIYDTFKLLDVSFVPESCFVPGTEFNETASFTSLAVPSKSAVADFEDTVHFPTREECDILRETTSELDLCFGNNSSTVQEVVVESMCESEGIGDSLNEVDEPHISGYQLMDECSRADFNMQAIPWKCNLSSGVVSMRETWQGLRRRRDDLKSYLTNSQKSNSVITKLASGLADLMSETDIMLGCCNPLITDILEPLLTPSVEPDASNWYDEQFEIGSTYAEHGLCFYAKKYVQIGENIGLRNTVDLALDMLTSTNNIMAWGKLISQGAAIKRNICNVIRTKEARYDVCTRRKLESGILNSLLPAVPSRLFMTLRGSGFNDYLSFMSHISKLECSRLSTSKAENPRRRSRASRHYLTSGPLSLSCEDTKLLASLCSFKESTPQAPSG